MQAGKGCWQSWNWQTSQLFYHAIIIVWHRQRPVPTPWKVIGTLKGVVKWLKSQNCQNKVWVPRGSNQNTLVSGHFVPPTVLWLTKSVIFIVAVYGIHQGYDEVHFSCKINIWMVDSLNMPWGISEISHFITNTANFTQIWSVLAQPLHFLLNTSVIVIKRYDHYTIVLNKERL